MNIVKAYSDVFRQAAPLVEPRVLFLPKGTSNKQMGIKFSICSFSFGYTIYIPPVYKKQYPGGKFFLSQDILIKSITDAGFPHNKSFNLARLKSAVQYPALFARPNAHFPLPIPGDLEIQTHRLLPKRPRLPLARWPQHTVSHKNRFLPAYFRSPHTTPNQIHFCQGIVFIHAGYQVKV